jgi:hypothetical protein
MDFFIAAVVVVILAAIAIVAVHADDSSSTDVPISLSGKWHQTEGLDGISMYAEIVEGSIQIDMQSRDARYIYWLGTFESYKDTFDYLYENEPGSILNVTVHAHFGARPPLAAMLHAIFKHMRNAKDVWFARHDEVARHVLSNP